MRDLTVKEIDVYLQQAQPKPLLLDVREPWEYNICHLPNSRLMPMRTVPFALGELNPVQEIIVICHHGIRSRTVAHFLEQQGFNNVINMRGGVAAWAREVDHSMATY